MVEAAADADPDHHRRAMLRAGFEHALHDVFLDHVEGREAEDFERRPAPRPERLGRTRDLYVIGAVHQIVADDRHVLALVAALVGQGIGDVLEDRRVDGGDQVVEPVGDRLLDVALEPRGGADLHEIDRDAGVGADVAIGGFRRVGALEHHGEDLARALVAFRLVGAAQRVLGVLRDFLQRAFVELRRNRFDDLVGNGHRRSPGLRRGPIRPLTRALLDRTRQPV